MKNFLFFLALAHFIIGPAQAQDAAPAVTSPLTIKVGIYLLNVGRFDLAAGSYDVDFYLTFTSDKPMGPQKFEFMNGRLASAELSIDEATRKQWRVHASLLSHLNFKDFPWDHHTLPIVLESPIQDSRQLRFEVDPEASGIDDAVVFVGWKLKGHTMEQGRHHYKVYRETYDQYRFGIQIERLWMATTIKTLLPILCFLIVMFMSLFVHVEFVESRIGMNTAMLIAAVMFHINIASQLPSIGYLTIADKMMLSTYAIAGLNLGLSVLIQRYAMVGKKPISRRLFRLGFVGVPFFALLAYLASLF